MAVDLKDIRESHDYDRDNWQDIMDEGQTDMQFVAGDPWDDDDKKARKGRPTVAPEEMGQYFNQVINALRSHPRGMKFAPQGNGANDEGARFYQNKAREVEYRSHAKVAYITAAQNAIERSYGYVRVNTKYATPRSLNPDIWIESFPNPDMVLPDTDALRPDLSDATRCLVKTWMNQGSFKAKYPKASVKSFSALSTDFPSWVKGDRIQVAEAWRVETRTKQLLLVQPMPQPADPNQPPQPPPAPIGVFEDEWKPEMGAVIRKLRQVEEPFVKMYLTNGLEILNESPWAGKYIPIVACFGKVLYVQGDAGMEKKILSMTRFGRDPWKSYCYCCSQQLEVVAQVPKAPVHVWKGQIRGEAMVKEWRESGHVPKPWLETHHLDEDGNPYPSAPQRIDYPAGAHLQALEVVKEGFRRAIQAAMGSNFLPTQAQRRNDKSGVALDKIEQAATQGTYHFVDSYDDLIRQTGVIYEDLCGKVHDYEGEVDVIDDVQKSSKVYINGTREGSVSTKGDYVCTVSTGPSNDSEREAAQEFTDTLIGQLERVSAVAGPQAAAKVLARAVRMRNLGPIGDEIADLIDPPVEEGQEPPSPREMELEQQVQQMTQILQQASQEKQAKVVEIREQGKVKYALEQLKADTTAMKTQADNETKIAVAELGAKVERMALFLEERERVGLQTHEILENIKDRLHEMNMARMGHQHALEAGEQGVAGQLTVQANAPQPQNNGASA